MIRIKRLGAALLSSALLAAGIAAPASAQPIVTGGLVNVTVVDVADVTLQDVNVAVGAALGIAANVCNVNVAVLAVQLSDQDRATCTNAIDGTRVTITQA
jgi:uncharacterized protein involved in high-affinity Fe2+ transport